MTAIVDALNSLSPLALVPLAALWFCLVATGLGWMSGWRRMAAAYRHPGSGPPLRLVGRSRIGWVQYKNVLRVGMDEEALYLGVLFLFRPGHPPLRVPWSQLEFGTRVGLLSQFGELTVHLPDRQTVTLRLPVGRWEALQQRG